MSASPRVIYRKFNKIECAERLAPKRFPTRSIGQVRKTMPDSNSNLRFYECAFHLLYGDEDILPLPRTDGFEGNTYLTKADYASLGKMVCEQVPWVSASDWWGADNVQRTAYMEAAVAQIGKSSLPSQPPPEPSLES